MTYFKSIFPVDWLTICQACMSFVGFGITIWQLMVVKRKTAHYQQQVNEEVVAAQWKIRSGLSLSKVPRASQYIKDAIHCLQQGK